MKLPYILILGCFDTKGEVFAYLRQCLLEQGERVVMLNTGIRPSQLLFPVDIEAEEVALAANVPLDQLREKGDRGWAVETMGRGAAQVLARLVLEGGMKAAISMGGGGGTYIALKAMQSVPFGTPKLCLTTMAAKDLSRQMAHKDITLMPSVVDVARMNSIIKPIIQQAAAAICAMANVTTQPQGGTSSGTIAISMFGNTTACVDQCTSLLEKKGYEVLAFHANGVGGQSMEALIRERCFDAVLDVTTTELADELCGGVCSAGANRLTAAAEVGIPQVVVPGCMDMVNFAEPDTVPAHFRDRLLYSWSPSVTLMRTNVEENYLLGKQLTEKLTGAKATIVLPLGGLSQIDAEGEIFYDPEANRSLFDSIRKHRGEELEVRESHAHINDSTFADHLVKTLLAMLEKEEFRNM